MIRTKIPQLMLVVIMVAPSVVRLSGGHLQSTPGQLQAGTAVVIKAPTDGSNVGKEIVVKGTAQMRGDDFLWLLVRRVDFEPVWWPQRAVKVDPKTGEWAASGTIGGPQDIGSDFDVAVITVNASGHQQLMDYWTKAMTTGEWQPTKIPNTTSPPRTIRVHKTSDR